MSDKKKDAAPPKLTKKQQEALRHEQAMKQAADDAQRLYKFHERERKAAEATDKANRDNEIFGRVQEEHRLSNEQDIYRSIGEEYDRDRRLAIGEWRKHHTWNHLMEVSWLPSVHSESDIRAFVEAWRNDQLSEFDIRPPQQDVSVKVQYAPRQPGQQLYEIEKVDMTYVRSDCGPHEQQRKKKMNQDLKFCVLAVQLADGLWNVYDGALVEGDEAKKTYCRNMLTLIYEQISSSLDLATVNVIQYMDSFLGSEEYLWRTEPKENPVIKFGFWARPGVQQKSGNGINFSDIGIKVEPKREVGEKLPKMLHKENAAMRAMQLTFDPFSVTSPPGVGQEYYALDAVIIVESMTFQERVRREKGTEWSSRIETTHSQKLNKQEYPPNYGHDSKREDEYKIKISFEVPENVVIRRRQPYIGKWDFEGKKWEHCCTCDKTFEPIVRQLAFIKDDLTAMAIIQEKSFDIPYEQWQLFPLSDDQILYVIECHRRGDTSDREVKILVEDAVCKLISPEEKELAALRSEWMAPATLLRKLARAGYNFLLEDADAQWTSPKVRPKSQAMEAKGYKDVAMHCTRHAFASTRHNKMGEDPNMCLFRISKDQRAPGAEEPFYRDVDEDDKWHSIRYEKERCVLAAFKDSDTEPDISNLDGKETHLNLHMMLAPEYPAPPQALPNHLLQNAVLQLLQLTRPFTWG